MSYILKNPKIIKKKLTNAAVVIITKHPSIHTKTIKASICICTNSIAPGTWWTVTGTLINILTKNSINYIWIYFM